MSTVTASSLEEFIATRLPADRERLTRAWLERIGQDADTGGIGMPDADDRAAMLEAVLSAASPFVRSGAPGSLAGDPVVAGAVRGFAEQRRNRGCAASELLAELDVLAELLDAACMQWIESFTGEASPDAVVRSAGRLNRIPLLVAAIAVGVYRDGELAERERSATRLKEFTDILLHELNTPLGAAETMSLLLDDDRLMELPEKRRHVAAVVQRNLRRVRLVLSDVRKLALTRAGRSGPSRWLPLPLVVRQVVLDLQEQVHAAGVRLELTGTIPQLSVDAARVELVLVNLIGNAVRYSDPARGDPWVRLSFHPVADGWWAMVEDNGIGVRAEHQDRIFDRFFRADPDHSEGSGLGLTIVREAVRQLGGRIELQSQPGSGSCFRLFVPTGGASTR